MNILYKSPRVGKNGKVFNILKFKTLREGGGVFAKEETYLPLGKFLRKTKIDELPQLWNILRRDMNIFGPRAEEERTIHILPEEMKKVLLSVRPGLIDLASIHFFEEEKILQQFTESHRAYWEYIRPLKFTLQAFYIEHRCFLLDLAITWLLFKKIIKSLFR